MHDDNNIILLLVGSPRGKRSTSNAIAEYLESKIKETGCKTRRLMLSPLLLSENGKTDIINSLKEAGSIVLAAPLYADGLPSGVLELMELVTERADKKDLAGRSLTVVINSGFPEAKHSELALAMAGEFAKEAGLSWHGGLIFGGGEAIKGTPLREAGGRARFLREALDLVASSLAKGEAAPKEAAALMARPFVPSWLYIFMGNLGWRVGAYKNRAYGKLKDRPYE
ncbi:MAG: hypothetical protein HZB33_12845 [Nitrospirae bacterium]|nr:hypothetical protein [Nitrospirota bacterium]